MRKKNLILIVIIFSLIGLFTSMYLAWDHYRTEDGILCEISGPFSCDITKNSNYAELFGIPVGIFGMIWFLFMTLLSLIEKKKEISNLMLIWSLLGLVFVGYFVHGEYVLKSVCPYCTIAHVCTLLIFTATVDLYRQRRR